MCYFRLLADKGVDHGVVNLQLLRLNGLDKITDEATTKFCMRNKKLEVLELCKCAALTAPGIDLIIKSLNCLRSININMIPKIKLEELKEGLEQKPNLKVLQ